VRHSDISYADLDILDIFGFLEIKKLTDIESIIFFFLRNGNGQKNFVGRHMFIGFVSCKSKAMIPISANI
jgi:hypothetical protein